MRQDLGSSAHFPGWVTCCIRDPRPSGHVLCYCPEGSFWMNWKGSGKYLIHQHIWIRCQTKWKAAGKFILRSISLYSDWKLLLQCKATQGCAQVVSKKKQRSGDEGTRDKIARPESRLCKWNTGAQTTMSPISGHPDEPGKVEAPRYIMLDKRGQGGCVCAQMRRWGRRWRNRENKKHIR